MAWFTDRPNWAYHASTLQAAGIAGAVALVAATADLPIPRTAAMALGMTGVGVVVIAWLLLGRQLGAIGARRMYAIAASWSLPLLVARPLFSNDIWSYLAQGVIAATGRDPYRIGPGQALGPDSPVTQHVSRYWVDTPAPYGPVWETLSRTVAQIAGTNLVMNVLLYRVIALAGVAMVAWALPRLARRLAVPVPTALWLGLLNPLVLWHLVAGAHNDALLVGLMLVGAEFVLRGRDRGAPDSYLAIVAGGTLLAVATNVKIVALVAIAILTADVARRSGRPVAAALAALLGGVVVTVAISVGSGLGFGWTGALRACGSVYSWLAPTTDIGLLAGAIAALAGAHVTATAITVMSVIGAIACAIVVARLMWAAYRARIHPLRAIGLAFAAVLLFAPVVQPWYVLWAVLPLAVTARTRRDRNLIAAASAAFAVALPPVVDRPMVLIAGYLIAALLIGPVGVVLLRRRGVVLPRRRQGAAAGGPAPDTGTGTGTGTVPTVAWKVPVARPRPGVQLSR